MIQRHATEYKDNTLRDFHSCDLPFDGKVIVIWGDICQILLVIQHSSKASCISPYSQIASLASSVCM